MKLIYTILLYLTQPIIWLILLFSKHRNHSHKYRWLERYGFCKNKIVSECILLHSVSLGEIKASIPLIQILRKRYPSLPITLTTMTFAGSEYVKLILSKDVYHVYLPYDLPCAMNRFVDTIRPKLVIIMETELWPNMISALYRRKIPIIIANARLSEASIKGYNRLGKFMQYVLSKVTLVAAQDKENAAHFISLGLKRNQLTIMGNLKFDCSITSELIASATMLRYRWASNRQVWIATSTHDGEELIVLKAHKKLLETFPGLLLILVPRHPNRFKNVCRIVKRAGFSFILRSTGKIPHNTTQVVIGDTIGELMLLYGIADVAFVGGSLVNIGGHNPLEPATYAIPIIMGPYTFNFKNICYKLKQADGLITVFDTNSLIKNISNLLNNKNRRTYYGNRAVEVLNKNKGASLRLMDILEPYLIPLQKNHDACIDMPSIHKQL